jgi:transcription elongation factor GreA
MSETRDGASLLRATGLTVDGPLRWGSPVPSRRPGVFVVELPALTDEAPIDHNAVRAWIERVPTLRLDGERPVPGDLVRRLASFWVPTETVVYVGRSAKALGGRVAAMYATPLGDRRPHAGGHWLKTLRDVDRLRLWWVETDAPEETEDAVLGAYAEGLAGGALPSPVLPFANLETTTGERRAHGIEGALADGAAGGQPAGTATGTGASTGRTSARAGTGTRATGGGRATTTRRTPAPRRTAASPPAREAPAILSADGLARLHEELRELREVQRPQVINRVAAARALGDLRENADYDAARNEQSFLEGRIRALEALLSTAQVIETDRSGEVALGSTVELELDGEPVTYRIVGSAEASPADGRISNVSPVGRALLGHRAGDEVAIQLPTNVLRARVVDVR